MLTSISLYKSLRQHILFYRKSLVAPSERMRQRGERSSCSQVTDRVMREGPAASQRRDSQATGEREREREMREGPAALSESLSRMDQRLITLISVRDVRRGEEDQIRGRSEERKSIGEEQERKRRGPGEEEQRRGTGDEQERRGTGEEEQGRGRARKKERSGRGGPI